MARARHASSALISRVMFATLRFPVPSGAGVRVFAFCTTCSCVRAIFRRPRFTIESRFDLVPRFQNFTNVHEIPQRGVELTDTDLKKRYPYPSYRPTVLERYCMCDADPLSERRTL